MLPQNKKSQYTPNPPLSCYQHHQQMFCLSHFLFSCLPDPRNRFLNMMSIETSKEPWFSTLQFPFNSRNMIPYTSDVSPVPERCFQTRIQVKSNIGQDLYLIINRKSFLCTNDTTCSTTRTT